jgi:tetratricopeptide (TPR) repeat protein/predicted Ser/Thr protein kinase
MSFPELTDEELAEALAQARDPQEDPLARQWAANVREALLGRSGEPTRVGRFVIVRKVGKGGMGTVFLAYDPDLDRKVALKVLRARGETAREELLREGRALARLSHPNVVTVFEVGSVDDDLFVAMEYVEGLSLSEWLSSKPDVRSIRQTFLSAGAGLEAAHRAGLVHRDFKPANVLVGDDGSVQVVDFGLARLEEDLEQRVLEDEPTSEDPKPWRDVGARPFRSETTAGRRGGTFAYMAPERLLGKRGDARSDQFSFCVALYEALFRKRPFVGESVDAIITAIEAGPSIPSGTTPRTRRVLQRGLSSDPGHRFASMQALIDALRVEPKRRSVALFLVGLGIVTVGSVYIAASNHDQPMRCDQAAAQDLAEVWNDERQNAIEAHFQATGLDFARTSFERSDAILTRYADAWTTMRTEACEATWTRGQQSQAALDLRMACLDRRLDEFRALTDLFAEADAALVRKSVSAAERLTPLAACADVESLAAVVPPPENEQLKQVVDQVRADLARGWAQLDSDHPTLALEISTEAVSKAQGLEYRPALAEAMLLQAHAQRDLGNYEQAEDTAKQAMYAAEAARHDEATARAATLLAHLTRRYATRPETSEDWAELARAAYTRMGVADGLTSELSMAIANNHMVGGRHADAIIEYERALGLANAEGRQTRRASILSNIGAALRRQGKYQEARAKLEEALGIASQLGVHHPTVASVHNNLANVLDEAGDADAALEHYQAGLAGFEHNYGSEHIDVAQLHNNIGTVYEAQDQFEQARASYETALTVARKVHEGEHRDIALWTTNLGGVLNKLGKPAEALAAHEESLAMFSRVLPADHPLNVYALLGQGEDLNALQRFDEAQQSLERAEELAKKSELDAETIEMVEEALAIAKAKGAAKP